MLKFFAAAAVAVAMPCLATAAQGQAYPSRPIKIIVAAAPGGVTDLLARVTADYISARTAQQVVVENRTGAGGNIGMDAVAKSPPDGYTLGMAASSNLVINPFLFKRMPFDALADLVPVAAIAEAPQMIAVNDRVAAASLAEFVALAKAKPGAMSYASAGRGTTMHFAADSFARIAKVDLTHVPYRGASPAVTDVVAGNVQMISISIGPILSFVEAGRMRVLATATPRRLRYLPEVPTSAEAGYPGYEMTTWFGLVGPAGMPKEAIDTINRLVESMLADAEALKRMEASHLDYMRMTPAQFAELVKADFAKWQRIVRESGVEPE